MAKSKRQQQPKRIGQSQPGGSARAVTASKAAAPINPINPSKASGAAASGSTTSANATAAGGSRLSAIREKSQAGGRMAPPQRKRFAQTPWWRRNLGALITVAVIVVAVGGFVAYAKFQNNQAAAGIGDAVPGAVMTDLTTVPATTFTKVGAGSVQNQLQATAANTPLLTASGKPEIIYVGAEYCPYCAAERWGTVVALSRFGSFSGLRLMRSSSTDVYPNTPTLSFRNVTYTSKYIVFNATETQDRNGTALATPPADVLGVFNTYDTAPYTTSQGSIPFMSYGNQYVTVGGPFFPTMLAGLTWQQASSQLKDPNSDVAKAIIGSANYQTAAICKLTNNQPGNVCETAVIQGLEAKLPAAK